MPTKAERVAVFNAEQRRRAATRLEAAKDDIQDLWLNRFIWRTTARIAGTSEAFDDNPFFMYWLTSQYAQAACVAIRRLTESGDKAKTTNSLVAVLEDITAHAQAHRWQSVPADYRATDGTVNPLRVQDDINELRAAANKVGIYVNKHLAHLEQKPSVAIPTVVDLDTAIDLLGAMLHRYMLLVTGHDLEIATKLLFDWTAVFNQAWRTSTTTK